jgi:hypothetical protein
MDDVIAWHFDERGLFSVRSAYKIHREISWMNEGRGASSSTQENNGEDMFWKKLWKLDCPGKVKHFLWRMAHNSLALRVNLARRHMEVDTRCVVCNRLDENGGHLFCTCKFVKHLWQQLLEHVHTLLAALTSTKEMMKEIWGLEQEESLTVVLLLCHWWLERNRIREGERRRDLAGLIYIIRTQAEEFLNLATKLNSSPNESRKKLVRPAGDVLKINSNGAFNPATRKGGWGFVIRDSQGTEIHAGAGAVGSPQRFECPPCRSTGCLAGVRAAGEWGMTNIVAETDSMQLKMAIGGSEFALAPTGGLVHENKATIAAYFSSFSVNYCPRYCNSVDHELAARGCMCSPNADLSWDGVPEGLENLVAGDCTEYLV